jgi:hypothetical protein
VTPDRVSLARLATTVADQAAARHQWALAGLLRQCAHAILEGTPPAEDGCGWCGGPLTGRQALWCCDAHRKSALRARSATSPP